LPALAGLRKASPIRAGMVSRCVGGQSPPTQRDERESAQSEGRRAGASERLFESLPELAKHHARSGQKGLSTCWHG